MNEKDKNVKLFNQKYENDKSSSNSISDSNKNKDDNLNSSFNPNDFNFHEHNGIDSKKLNPRNFLGFPVFRVTDATVAPTDAAQDGIFRFYYDAVPVYRLWLRINKSWHYLTLT